MRTAHKPWAALAAGIVLPLAAAAAPLTFFMDEVTSYSDIGICTNDNLNTVTESLASTMRADAWTGARYVNAGAWPQDFRDRALDATGLDDTYGDTKSLTVFAGHGNAGLLTFRPRNGVCTASAGANMALGYGSTGGASVVGMWLSCDMFATGLLDESWSMYRRMNLRQSLGWLNTIGIGDNEPRDFYNKSKSMANKDAWLQQMAGGTRQPLVLTATTATDANTCWTFHGMESLGRKVVDTLYGSWGYRCWEYIAP